MSARDVPEDWSADDRSARREALGALRARLRDDPLDVDTRAEIVRAYRQLGHPEQAGRFAIALEAGAQREEVRAYSDMLRRLGADDNAARRLSMMPAESDLPIAVRRAIERGPLDMWRPWGVYVGIAWGGCWPPRDSSRWPSRTGTPWPAPRMCDRSHAGGRTRTGG